GLARRTGPDGEVFRPEPLDGEISLDALEVVPGQRQVGLLPFEDQVEEQALLVAGVLEHADQVVLLRPCSAGSSGPLRARLTAPVRPKTWPGPVASRCTTRSSASAA